MFLEFEHFVEQAAAVGAGGRRQRGYQERFERGRRVAVYHRIHNQ